MCDGEKQWWSEGYPDGTPNNSPPSKRPSVGNIEEPNNEADGSTHTPDNNTNLIGNNNTRDSPRTSRRNSKERRTPSPKNAAQDRSTEKVDTGQPTDR